MTCLFNMQYPLMSFTLQPFLSLSLSQLFCLLPVPFSIATFRYHIHKKRSLQVKSMFFYKWLQLIPSWLKASGDTCYTVWLIINILSRACFLLPLSITEKKKHSPHLAFNQHPCRMRPLEEVIRKKMSSSHLPLVPSLSCHMEKAVLTLRLLQNGSTNRKVNFPNSRRTTEL